MAFAEYLLKIPEDKFLAYLLLALSLIIPGFGYLYLMESSTFLGLDILKLMGLSIFFSLPLFIIGFLFVTFLSEKLNILRDIFLTSYISLIFFFLSIFLFYVFSYFLGPPSFPKLFIYVFPTFILILGFFYSIIKTKSL